MLMILAFVLAVVTVLVLDWIVRHVYEIHRAVEVRRFDRWLKEHPEV
jgi:hypothetical protein